METKETPTLILPSEGEIEHYGKAKGSSSDPVLAAMKAENQSLLDQIENLKRKVEMIEKERDQFAELYQQLLSKNEDAALDNSFEKF